MNPRAASTAQSLRKAAEERIRKDNSKTAEPSTDFMRMVYELEIHQVELEMQNEELVAARHDLEQSLQRYSDLFEFAPIAYCALMKDGTMREVNLAAARLLRQARGRLLGVRFQLFVADTHKQAFATLLDEVSRTDGWARLLELKLALDGETLDIRASISALRGAGPATPGLLLALEDVTAERRAQEALRIREGYFKLLSEVGRRLLGAEEPEEAVKGSCNAIASHFGCEVSACFLVDGEPLRPIAMAGIAHDELEPLSRALGAQEGARGRTQAFVAETPEPFSNASTLRAQHDPRIRTPAPLGLGALVWNPLRAEGRFIGSLLLGRRQAHPFTPDEIERLGPVADLVAVGLRQLVARKGLNEANTRLQEAAHRKDEFLALLSHELRNPLAGIRSSSEVLQRRSPGSEAAQKAQAIVQRQAEHMTRIVDDLLDGARILNGKVELRTERLDLNELVLASVEDHQREFEEKGVRLEVEPATAPIVATADPTRVAQVMANLLHNAAKFSPAGSTTRVQVGIENGRALIRVQDGGRGIAPEDLPHLFDPFFQAGPSLPRHHGGLGLGLSLVKGLIELHGGTVDVESPGLGQGATFSFTLPLSSAAPPDVPPTLRPTGTSVRRLLVVEDQKDVADSFVALLEAEGYEVRATARGGTALPMARDFQPHVVLCDLGLPDMSGYDVARAFRSEPEMSHIRLVAISGYARSQDVLEGKRAGFDAHLSKPVVPQKLWELLNRL